MEDILIIRENLISFYKRFETYIVFALKFIVGVIIFSIINSIGFVRPEFAQYVSPPVNVPYTMMLSLLFSISPFTFGYLLMMVAVTIQLSAVPEVAILTLLLMLCIMFLYIRLAPKKCILIIATILAFYFRVPYVIPLFAGLYMGLTSIMPISIGVFIWSFIPNVHHLILTTESAEEDLFDMAYVFLDTASVFLIQLSENTSWIFIAFIFSMVVIAVYAISRLSINYAMDMAIAIGAVLCFLSYAIAIILAELDVNILIELLFMTLSACIVLLIRFFDIALDYGRAEKVQFEDEEYYYYVKTIPKAIVTKSTKVVKRIKPDPDEEDAGNSRIHREPSQPPLKRRVESGEPETRRRVESNPETRKRVESNPETKKRVESNPETRRRVESNPETRRRIESEPDTPAIRVPDTTRTTPRQESEAIRKRREELERIRNQRAIEESERTGK